jgi:hypothetical protein
MVEALYRLGPVQWYTPPQGLISAFDNYYLPGTQPDSPPPPVVAAPAPAPTGGGVRKKKKGH